MESAYVSTKPPARPILRILIHLNEISVDVLHQPDIRKLSTIPLYHAPQNTLIVGNRYVLEWAGVSDVRGKGLFAMKNGGFDCVGLTWDAATTRHGLIELKF